MVESFSALRTCQVNLRVPNLKLPKVPGAGLRRLLHKAVRGGQENDKGQSGAKWKQGKDMT